MSDNHDNNPDDETIPTTTDDVVKEFTGGVLPVLPLRDIVVFPHMIVPLFVGRVKSVRALEEVMQDDKQILLVAQKDASEDDPSSDDIYEVGTVGQVLQLLKLPDQTVKVLVEGTTRARVKRFTDREDFFEAEVEPVPIPITTMIASKHWHARLSAILRIM